MAGQKEETYPTHIHVRTHVRSTENQETENETKDPFRPWLELGDLLLWKKTRDLRW